MSKSDPDSAIFMEDAAEDVTRKILNAYCPSAPEDQEATSQEGMSLVEDAQTGRLGVDLNFGGWADALKNPCLDYIQYTLFSREDFRFQVGEQDLKDDFVQGKLEEALLKESLANEVNSLLEPVRRHFEEDAEAKELLEKVSAWRRGEDIVIKSFPTHLGLDLGAEALAVVFAPLPSELLRLSDVFQAPGPKTDTARFIEPATDQSSYHLSDDAKRVVVRLRKVKDSFAAGPWCCFLDVRTGRCHVECSDWPDLLQELQGAWRSEDEEPIELVGDQVIWPQGLGSRDTLLVEEESLLLQQAGDGGKVVYSECCGFYERQSYRIRWEDGDSWSRIPGLALERQEAGREALPLHYDQQLSRWIPWLPNEERGARSEGRNRLYVLICSPTKQEGGEGLVNKLTRHSHCLGNLVWKT
eukprot:g25545.t1